MKKFILKNVVLFFVTLLLITSCMGEGKSVESGQTFGVVRFDYKTSYNLLDVSDYESLYSIRFQTTEINDGDCYLVAFEIDHGIPENSLESVNANGFLSVTIIDKAPIERWAVSPLLTDTSKVMTNEVAITSSTLNWQYVKGIFFTVSSLEIPSNQTMNWNLSYDMDNTLTEEHGQKFYNVFLRTTIRSQGTFAKEAIVVANAFNMNYYLKSIAKEVKETGGKSIILRINYPSEISKDEQITWKYEAIDIPVEYILPE